jgi:hypothetical protein
VEAHRWTSEQRLDVHSRPSWREGSHRGWRLHWGRFVGTIDSVGGGEMQRPRRRRVLPSTPRCRASRPSKSSRGDPRFVTRVGHSPCVAPVTIAGAWKTRRTERSACETAAGAPSDALSVRWSIVVCLCLGFRAMEGLRSRDPDAGDIGEAGPWRHSRQRKTRPSCRLFCRRVVVRLRIGGGIVLGRDRLLRCGESGQDPAQAAVEVSVVILDC